jgi:tetratricopeptide (TPR) repeat protein
MYEKALAIMQLIGDEPGMSRQYNNLATCYQSMSDTALKLEFYGKSLEIKVRLGNHEGAAVTYFNMGLLYGRDIGDHAQAHIHFEKAKALFEIVGDMESAQQAATLALQELRLAQ